MTDQNPEYKGPEGQNPQSEQSQQPVYSQQSAPEQPQGQPSYQPQGQPNYQNQGQQYQGQPNYGQQTYGGIPPQDQPNNYMVMNIIATVLGFILCSSCCIGGIIGIVGIVFSNQSKSKYNLGDLNGSINDANTAKIIGIVSLVITGLGFIYSIVQLVTIFSAGGGIESVMENYIDMLENMK